MIFAIIDLLEKLLKWLRPFGSRETTLTNVSSSSEGKPVAPQPSEAVNSEASTSCQGLGLGRSADNRLSGLMEFTQNNSNLVDTLLDSAQDQEILKDLRDLKSDPSKNRDPFAWGMIFERASGRSIMSKREKAGLSVWYSLDVRWRGKYTILWAEV
ncbi:hypothetical protein OMR07_19785 [Methylobacterium organophilum]|nr:hypothetical protein [Methylobacterium organophilum]